MSFAGIITLAFALGDASMVAWVFMYAILAIAISAIALVLMWRISPFVYWMFWKYLKLVQRMTGLPAADWFCDTHIDDKYLQNSAKGSRESWLLQEFRADYEFRKSKAEI